jgi:hypothetical protein
LDIGLDIGVVKVVALVALDRRGEMGRLEVPMAVAGIVVEVE